ncbi:MAG: MarR family transcriptional regulator [Rhodospirillales bacterium 20-64-7]|nr:MAG: MarR family transcriptional regulator [Rhodospirillales bacterium 20-64-7]
MTASIQDYAPAALAADLRDVAARLKRRLQSHSQLGELTGTQIAVLARLDREGEATVTSLAKAEGVRPQSMGATIAGLQAAGHVQGTPDPADGRQTLLSLTPECRARIEAGRVARQDWLQRGIERELSDAERAELGHALRLLRRLVDG